MEKNNFFSLDKFGNNLSDALSAAFTPLSSPSKQIVGFEKTPNKI